MAGGSRKGKPNKITAELKDMILKALDQAGGVKYLAKQAEDSPAAFMSLLGKVLPLQVTGKDGKDLIPETQADPIEVARQVAFLLENGARAMPEQAQQEQVH